MKRRYVSIFFGIMFLLGGLIALFLYGMHRGQAFLLIVGVYLLLPFKSKNEPQNAASGAEGKPQDVSVNPTADRDTKTISFSVAGVTFSNESGRIRSRQTILRRIYFNDPPFDSCDRTYTVSLERYLYENEPAYYIKVNDYIIGNVPKEFVPHIEANADRPYTIDDFQIYGGWHGKKFGASLKMVFLDTLEA